MTSMDARSDFSRAEKLADGLAVGFALSLGGSACWMIATGPRDSNVFLVVLLALLIGGVLGVPIGHWKGRAYIGGHWLSPPMRKGLVSFSFFILAVSLVAVPLLPARRAAPANIVSRVAGIREKLQVQHDQAIGSGNK